jgi:hypothetical protein
LNDDWLDALAALLRADARFLVVGAHALAVHGVPRATQDLDIWIEPTSDNADRVWNALVAFGAPLSALGVEREDLTTPDTVIQLGLPPNRIDLLTGITGIAGFERAWEDRLDQDVEGLVVPFLGRAALVRNKLSTGRTRDLADIEALGESDR